MSFLRFRVKNKMIVGFFIYFIGTVSLILSLTIWKDLLYYFIGLVMVLSFMETILIKCPYCGKKPVNLLKRFPEECPHCKKKFGI